VSVISTLLFDFLVYFISARKHVVFGRVVSGEDIVDKIENLSVDKNSRPLKDVIISHCGQLVLVTSKSKLRLMI